MKKTVTLLLCFTLGVLQAQQSVLTSGGNATGSGGNASYSIGQMAYNTISGSNGSLAQGVQQAFEISAVLGVENHQIDLSYTVFPNPTTEVITLKINNFDQNNLSFQLYDIQGRILYHKKISSDSTQIPTQSLAPATYFLKVMQENQVVKLFKIIKK
jgi:hypothetical protein